MNSADTNNSKQMAGRVIVKHDRPILSLVVRLFNMVFPGCFLFIYILYSSRSYSDEGSYCIIDPVNMKIPYLHTNSSFEKGSIELLRRHPNYIDGNAQFNFVFFMGLFTYTAALLIGMANVY